jgi:molecular chaperone GrpE
MKHKHNNNEHNERSAQDVQREQHDLHAELHDIQKELHSLKDEFEQLQKEKADIFAQLQRVSADYVNYQKRIAKQISDTTAYEKEIMIKSLLPALDSFEHALAKMPTQETADALMKGMQIVYDQILDILKLQGVEQIKSLGEEFDPSLHSALTQRSEPDKPENIILEEIARGYKLNGRVIRPARVVVNKLTASQTAPPQAEPQPETPPAEDETTDTE